MEAKERIDRLVAKKLQLDAQLSSARAKLLNQERRNEVRRKIIAGAWLLKMNAGDWRKIGEKLRDAGMLDARDAKLFGLEESPLVPTQSQPV